MLNVTDITRQNWQSHCREPQLTEAEWQRWYTVTERIRTDREFADRVLEATEAEFQAERAMGKGDGWAGLVAEADASRRYRRAVIEIGERLNEQEAGNRET
jgi:hypothetical protein